MFALEATGVRLKEQIKNACTFNFSRISYNIWGAFPSQILFQTSYRRPKQYFKNDKMKTFRAYGRTGT